MEGTGEKQLDGVNLMQKFQNSFSTDYYDDVSSIVSLLRENSWKRRKKAVNFQTATKKLFIVRHE